MKTLRLLFALGFVAAGLTGATLRADEAKPEKKEEPACACEKGEDGKTCGVDKDCCCTGEKAKPKEEAKPAQPQG